MKPIALPLNPTSRAHTVLTGIAAGTYEHTPQDNFLLNRLHAMGWWKWVWLGGRSPSRKPSCRGITPAGRLALCVEPLVEEAIRATTPEPS